MSESTKPAIRNRVSYHALLLAAFTTVSAALLIFGNNSTTDPIAAREQEDMNASLSEVILPQLHDNNLLNDTITVHNDGRKVTIYQATKNGKLTGVAYKIYGYGYGGEIVLMMGVDPNGNILGVRVLSHHETPGLGDRIETDKSHWIFEFNGRSLKNTTNKQWHVKKDGGIFDQFSGATITPRAVVKAIKAGLVFFKDHKAEMTTLQTSAKS